MSRSSRPSAWGAVVLMAVGCGRVSYGPLSLADGGGPGGSDSSTDSSGVAIRSRLVVGDPANLEPDDTALADRLADLGEIVILDDEDPPPSELDVIVIIANSVGSTSVSPDFATAPIPHIVIERAVYDVMLMATASSSLQNEMNLTIEATSHPLTAGNPPGVYTLLTEASEIGQGNQLPSADVIATIAGDSVLFSYATGALLVGDVPAPSCRVAFPGGSDTAPLYTDLGWSLFDAAVTYAANCF